jgi:hypothetical protein
MYDRGVALGEELRGKDAHVYLGYVCHPKRDSRSRSSLSIADWILKPTTGAMGRHGQGGRN